MLMLDVAGLDGVLSCCHTHVGRFAIKQQGHVFKGKTTGLGVIEPHDKDHDDDGGEEYKVILPLDSVQGDRVDKGVEKGETERDHLSEGQALGSRVVRPDLDGIADDERCESNVVAEKVTRKMSI